MDRSGRWLLAARMVLTLSLIAVVSVVFLAVCFGVGWVAALFLDAFVPLDPPVLATALTVLGIAWLLWGERRQADSILRHNAADATPAEERSSELVALVDRLSQQADLPPPTVLVAHTDAPEAYATGIRKGNARLVLSEGLLSSLSRNEVRAVVAHELAHVNNRDAAVMTLAAFPTNLADAIIERFWHDNEDLDEELDLIAAGATFVSGVFYAVGRGLLSSLSRYRELVADDAAVALTGDPAALAGALRTLDEQAARTPDEDLRAQAGVSAFSIVPLDPEPYPEEPEVTLGPEGEREPYMYRTTEPIRPLINRLFSTHPPTDRRIERLQERQRSMETN